jgi:uncharacterized membrane protein YeaQ/YmgE (transglycosylase-associated protein family)
MMNIIFQLIVGLIIGAIARFVLPGKENIVAGPIGWLITAGLGCGGSLIGSLISKAIWKESAGAGWIMSILGAVLLLLLYRFLF